MGNVRFFQPLTYTKEASAAMAVASREFIASTPCDGLRHWWQSTVRLTRFLIKGSGKACVVSTVRSAPAKARRRRPRCRFSVIAVGLSFVCSRRKQTKALFRAAPVVYFRSSDEAWRAHTGAAAVNWLNTRWIVSYSTLARKNNSRTKHLSVPHGATRCIPSKE